MKNYGILLGFLAFGSMFGGARVWIEICGEDCLGFENGGGDRSIWGFLKGAWYFGKVVMRVMGVRYGKEGLN